MPPCCVLAPLAKAGLGNEDTFVRLAAMHMFQINSAHPIFFPNPLLASSSQLRYFWLQGSKLCLISMGGQTGPIHWASPLFSADAVLWRDNLTPASLAVWRLSVSLSSLPCSCFFTWSLKCPFQEGLLWPLDHSGTSLSSHFLLPEDRLRMRLMFPKFKRTVASILPQYIPWPN